MSGEITIPDFLDKIHSLLHQVKNIHDSELTKLSLKLDNTVSAQESTIALLSKEIEGLKEINAYLLKDKDALEKQVQNLEEEYRNFTKVSKIIALENENAKLKLELAKLTTTLSQTKKESKEVQTCVTPTVPQDVPTLQTSSQPVVPLQASTPYVSQSLSCDVETAEGNEEESIEVNEILIEEKEYYIDDYKHIYMKLEDGGIGDKIGVLGRKKGKYVIKI